MRRANDSQILIKDDVFIGISLGADYCAEHEWGIKEIKSAFGISSNNGYGLDRRKITKLPDTNNYSSLLRYTKHKLHYLVFEDTMSLKEYSNPTTNSTPNELYIAKPYKKDTDKSKIEYNMGCAWDENSFGIVTTKNLSPYLDALYHAFLDKDIVIFLGGGHVFKNAGLSICIASKLPPDVTEMWKNADIDAENLIKASNAIGIEDILKKAGKSWFDLSPKWTKDIKSANNTSYPVVYWLNPQNQKDNNFGWFTVEDLMLWAVNNGPIPKTL